MGRVSVPSWRPGGVHPLHDDATNEWIDANCYTDMWLELMHGLGAEPYPLLAGTLATDLEVDQWTFFKPAPEALKDLYGIELVELVIYRSLREHCADQLAAGRVPVLEVDAYFLPDVRSTYRAVHSKTTVAVVMLEDDPLTVGYLHNCGYFEAQGDDVHGLLRTGRHRPADPATLEPYVEIVKIDAMRRPGPPELLDAAERMWRGAVRSRPVDNPVARFAARLPADIARLAATPERYNSYAFATLRQFGSSAAFSARFLRWLGEAGGTALPDVALAYEHMSQGAKRLILKGARCMMTGRPLDSDRIMDDLAETWERADRGLRLAAAG